MPPETTPRRKGNDKYTVVFLPSDQSKKSRSFSVNLPGMIGVVVGAIALIIGSVLFLVIYTPFGSYLPITSPELEQLYGQKVNEIQQQLNSLVYEVTELQSYNQKLRKALGDRELRQSPDQAMASKDLNSEPPDVSSQQLRGTRSQENQIAANQSLRSDRISNREPGDEEKRIEIRQHIPLTMPVIGYRTRNYNDENNHLGVDIVAEEGSPVFAAANGTVLYSDWSFDDGLMLILAHGDGFTTVYKHNRALIKKKGEVVKRGETIALLGNSGRTTTGPHLHFEVWNNGIALNPMNYVITIQ